MTVHAVIYTVPNCQKCNMTERSLRGAMRVKMEHLFDGNDSWSETKIEKFRQQGYGSFPVVRIYCDETGKRLDDWCDLQMSNINNWKKAAQEEQ